MQRLNACQFSVNVWRDVLAIRKMVISPAEDVVMWHLFAKICRSNGQVPLADEILQALIASIESRLSNAYQLSGGGGGGGGGGGRGGGGFPGGGFGTPLSSSGAGVGLLGGGSSSGEGSPLSSPCSGTALFPAAGMQRRGGAGGGASSASSGGSGGNGFGGESRAGLAELKRHYAAVQLEYVFMFFPPQPSASD
jgi:hypothetical protein